MRMTDIVNIIKQIMAAGGTIESHDAAMMASIYAGQCQALNDRLNQCSDALQKGQTAQALSVAEENPPLLPLCQGMVEIESAGWADLCREKGWPLPTPLNREALERLKGAMTLEKQLTPLLSRLRRANNLGHGAECTAILREMISIDPDNPSWRSQLMAFESYRMQQIPGELTRLKEAKDLEGVAMGIVELKQQWHIPTDPALLADAEHFLEVALTDQARDQAVALFHRIDSAHGAEDAQALGQAVTELQQLEKSRYFKRDDAMAHQYKKYESAIAWYREKVRAFNDQNARSEILAQIDEKIAHGTDQGLRELLAALLRFDTPVPEGLEERVEVILDHAQKMRQRAQMKRRRRHWMWGAVMGSILLIASVFFYFRWEKSQLLVEFDAAIVTEDLTRARSILTTMSGSAPYLFNTGDLEKTGQRVDQLERLLENKQRAFKALLHRLEKMASHQFIGMSVEGMTALIREAHSKEKGAEKADLARLQLVEQLWNQKKLMVKAEDEALLSPVLDALQAELDSFSWGKSGHSGKGRQHEKTTHSKLNNRSNPSLVEPPMSVIESFFERMEALFKEANALHLPLVDENMRIRLNQFETQFVAIKEATARRDESLDGFHRAKTLQDYLMALGQFMETFPDDPVTPVLKSVLQSSPLYMDLIADPARSSSAGNLFRSREAAWLAQLDHHLSLHLDEVKERYRQMERTPRFVDLWRCTVQQPNRQPQIWYFSGEPTREFIDGIGSYSGIAYVLSSTDTQPDFESAHAITAHVQGLSKMPHCVVVQKMLDRLLFEPGIETLLHGMSDIYQQRDEIISPVLKLHLIHFLFQSLASLTGQDNVQEFKPMAGAFEDFIERSEVNWLCTAHRKYGMERRKAREILNRHLEASDPVGLFQIKLKLKQLATERVIRWVGWVDPQGEHALHFNSGAMPPEVWVLRQKKDTSPALYVAMERRGGDVIRYDDHNGFIPGEPLFAPYDSDITRKLIQSMMADVGDDLPSPEDSKFWPLIWPVNVRSVDGESQ